MVSENNRNVQCTERKEMPMQKSESNKTNCKNEGKLDIFKQPKTERVYNVQNSVRKILENIFQAKKKFYMENKIKEELKNKGCGKCG